MVVSANPYATHAGREILRAGGNAVDAAIAVQAVLGLVEPQSSGLGGGAFLIHWDAATRHLSTYDGRERAPAATTPEHFPSGRTFAQQVHSGASIGVPGVPRLITDVHARHASRPMPELLAPAIRLARDGFAVSPRLHRLLQNMQAGAFSPSARAYFFDAEGRPWPIGHRLRNPDYADTLARLGRHGTDGFYRGPVARAILTAAQEMPPPASAMTATDLADYRVIVRHPICGVYRAHRICGMGPPSSGALTVLQTLALLEPYALRLGSTRADAAAARLAPQMLHLIAEAEKLAYADRNHYIADPDAMTVPPEALLAFDYLDGRRQAIDPHAAMPRPPPGRPVAGRPLPGPDATFEAAGTSHISVVDSAGNAVAMTTTIEAAFGARTMAAGFLLNNELTDFSIIPRGSDGRLAANAPGPGKRPRSSMAPTIVFGPDGNLRAALGSPGGSRIILYVVKALIALIDWDLDAQSAAALPNFGSRGDGIEIEPERALRAHVDALSAYGHDVRARAMTSGLNIITTDNGHLEGGTDPRREGLALGD